MSCPAAPSATVRRRRHRLLVVALAAALAVAGCGPGGPSSPAATTGTGLGARPTGAAASAVAPESPLPATPQPATPEPATPEPTDPPGPPVASLVVPGGAPVRGALGGYVWDGAGADSPWIVPPADAALRGRGPYAVVLTPPLAVRRWSAAWARDEGGTAGVVEAASTGDAGPVSVRGPGSPGAWSLKVDVRFGDGRHATWYWRVEIAP